MSEREQWFREHGEPYAAGFFEAPERGLFYRHALAYRRYWEQMPLMPYAGGRLYPNGAKSPSNCAVQPSYSFTFDRNPAKLEEPGRAWALEMPMPRFPSTPHTVGGAGYTHSMPNFRRVLADGLNAYEARVRAKEDGDFKDGLLTLLAGARTYRERCLTRLREANADEKLIAALEKVPFEPADTLYEALVAWNFTYYLDGCDNPGPLDAGLYPYWRGEDATNLLREFFLNVDANGGWSGALGPKYNELTLQCLKASHGLRRPSFELRVTPDMPEAVWQAAVDALSTGSGSPALYNEPLYQDALAKRFPDMPECDRLRFNGGGCTETMLDGISNVGSLDAGVNLPLIFSRFQARLPEYTDFGLFYAALLENIRADVLQTLDHVNTYRREREKYLPQPVRTLLVDDCIERGLDFNAGGARYMWSVINLAGVVNVVDSLLAVKTLVYDAKEYAPEAFLSALEEGSPAFRARLRRCPCFGVDDEAADALAADFAGKVFAMLDERTPYLGRAFLPSSIQFVTYTDAGKRIPATPDGREADAPLADSLGAILGKDVKGPTALLNSVSALPLHLAVGTPVLNVRMQKAFLREHLRPLAQAFFERGGMQMQITCVSREELEDAMRHPDAHPNLIVRVGGYAEYWKHLSPELRQTVYERTAY